MPRGGEGGGGGTEGGESQRRVNSHEANDDLQACQSYFEVLFEVPPDGVAPRTTEECIALATDNRDCSTALQARHRLARAYGMILFKEGGSYSFLHNEKIFFEGLYDFTIRVTAAKFDRIYWCQPHPLLRVLATW